MQHTYKKNDIYGILVDAIHFQIEKFKDISYKHEQLWSIVKSVVWVVKKIGKSQTKEFGNLETKINILPFQTTLLGCYRPGN